MWSCWYDAPTLIATLHFQFYEIGCSHEMKTMVEKDLLCKCSAPATSSRPSAVAGQIIAGIEIKCINHENGCNERMTLGKGFSTFANHLKKVCKGVKIECYQCDMSITRSMLDTHLIADCPFRWVTCQHCSTVMMSCQYDDHIIKSLQSPRQVRHESDCNATKRPAVGSLVSSCVNMLLCPNGCSSNLIPKGDIDKHEKSCALAAIECSICSISFTRSSMVQHMNDTTQQHMVIMNTKADKTKVRLTRKIEQLNEKVKSLSKENNELRTEMTSLTNNNKDLLDKVVALTNKQVGLYARLSLWYDTNTEEKLGDLFQASDTITFGGLKWFFKVWSPDLPDRPTFDVDLQLPKIQSSQLSINVQCHTTIGHGVTSIHQISNHQFARVGAIGSTSFAKDKVIAAQNKDKCTYCECNFTIIPATSNK
jgi:hypothetical protein